MSRNYKETKIEPTVSTFILNKDVVEYKEKKPKKEKSIKSRDKKTAIDMLEIINDINEFVKSDEGDYEIVCKYLNNIING